MKKKLIFVLMMLLLCSMVFAQRNMDRVPDNQRFDSTTGYGLKTTSEVTGLENAKVRVRNEEQRVLLEQLIINIGDVNEKEDLFCKGMCDIEADVLSNGNAQVNVRERVSFLGFELSADTELEVDEAGKIVSNKTNFAKKLEFFGLAKALN